MDRWKKLPYLANYQEPGTPKPGAVVLAEMIPGGKRPIAAAGHAELRPRPHRDVRHRREAGAGRCRSRWRTSRTRCSGSRCCAGWFPARQDRCCRASPKIVYSDEQAIPLRAEVRDKNYMPLSDARVEAHIMGPDGVLARTLNCGRIRSTSGLYTADWGAVKPGSYVVETVAQRGRRGSRPGRVDFRREDGVAENFRHAAESRTAGKARAATQAGGTRSRTRSGKLAIEISYSEAGISVRETRDLWDMPIFFLMRSAAALRRMAAAPEMGSGLRSLLYRCRSVGFARAGDDALPGTSLGSAASRIMSSASPPGRRRWTKLLKRAGPDVQVADPVRRRRNEARPSSRARERRRQG